MRKNVYDACMHMECMHIGYCRFQIKGLWNQYLSKANQSYGEKNTLTVHAT